jgi:[ribosomal protein S18]-alanine N-acetyltransferase
MQIVEMQLEHIQQVRNIESITGMTPWSEEDYAYAIAEANRWRGWVALAEGCAQGSDLVGFSLLAMVPPESELAKLAVLPDWQRRGIASRLFDKTIGHARAVHCQVCYLEVRSRNQGAIVFYTRHGFSTCGRRRNYYRNPADDALLMVCPIHPV